MAERLGFIGLGAMGLPVASNLVKAGFEVLGFDIDPASTQAFVTAGGVAASGVDEVAQRCDAVFTMVPEGSHVLKVATALAAAGFEGKLLIDLSTIGVQAAKQLHEMATAKGFRCLEAPVTGGVLGAQKATLTLMVAGDEGVFESAARYFSAIGKQVVYAGGPGCGQAIKTCNNMAAGIIKIAISEAFALSRRLGVSDEVLFKVASNGSANCFALTNSCPVPGLVATSPSSRDYRNGFATKLMLKDMLLAQETAAKAGVPVLLGSAAAAMYQQCVNSGLGDLDNGVVFQYLVNELP